MSRNFYFVGIAFFGMIYQGKKTSCINRTIVLF